VRSIGRVVEHIFLSEPLQRFCMLFYHRFHLKFFKTLVVWWFSTQNRHQSEICTNARHLLTEAPAPCFSNPFIHAVSNNQTNMDFPLPCLFPGESPSRKRNRPTF
jgi:hypothetical protein